MHELATRTPGGHRVQAALHEVLDRLHVVVGLALDALDLRRVGVGQLGGERVETVKRLGGQAAQLRDARLGRERLEPQRLDANALTDQPALAEERPQLGGLVGVAAVDGRDRVQRMVVHCLQKRFAVSQSVLIDDCRWSSS